MQYLSPIDPHVHLRGEEYKDIDYLAMGFRDAELVGVCALAEQPNPTPWLTNVDIIRIRRMHVSELDSFVRHNIHIGLTTDKNQVVEALKAVQANHLRLVSDKTFYTHSTGNMGLLDHELQKWIWCKKGEMNYTGISIGHFEDETEYIGAFNPARPVSHSEYQIPFAELKQVQNQIVNAIEAKFQGVFYIAHCSNPETVDYIEKVRPTLPFKVVIEVTWHHMFLNWEDYNIHGNRVKMNPPLRSKAMQEKLLEYVLAGKLDIIGTDHAPHPISRKDDPEKPASGIPGILFWPRGIELLRKFGISSELLDNMIFHNANKLFKWNLTPQIVDIKYDPTLWDRYGYNPFIRLDT